MKLNGLFIIIALFISLMSSPLYLSAQPFGGHGMGQGMGRGMGHGPGWALKQLDLSSEQQEQLACDTAGQGREMKDALARERLKLNDMIRDKSIPEEQIFTQLDKVDHALSDWNHFRLQKMLKARSVLTEAQLKKLIELQEDSGRGEVSEDSAH